MLHSYGQHAPTCLLSQTNGSALTLVAESLYQYPQHRRTFPIATEDDEKILIDYLLRKPVPDLIIRIIDYDHEQDRGPSRASIDDAIRQTMQTIMEQTSEFDYCNRIA
jgi:hypothetical protein